LVLANPPYRTQGSGRVSPKAGRDDARHESTATLRDFLSIAKYLVKPQGRICFIHHPARLAEFMAETTTLKLAPLRLRMVHGNMGAEARMFLIELAKGRGGMLRIEPPLLVYDENRYYSVEMKSILGVNGC
jgi:tRNA1Val (adenine37-N6)-methyltransferase